MTSSVVCVGGCGRYKAEIAKLKRVTKGLNAKIERIYE